MIASLLGSDVFERWVFVPQKMFPSDKNSPWRVFFFTGSYCTLYHNAVLDPKHYPMTTSCDVNTLILKLVMLLGGKSTEDAWRWAGNGFQYQESSQQTICVRCHHVCTAKAQIVQQGTLLPNVRCASFGFFWAEYVPDLSLFQSHCTGVIISVLIWSPSSCCKHSRIVVRKRCLNCLKLSIRLNSISSALLICISSMN